MNPSDLVLHLLSSIGRPEEARVYLSAFRAQKRERFATIWIDDDVVREMPRVLVMDLTLLGQLGLTPVLAFESDSSAEAFQAAVGPANVVLRRTDESGAAEVATAGEIPLVTIDRNDLPRLCAVLQTRKAILLGAGAGLTRASGANASLVDLAAEYDELMAPGELSDSQRLLVDRSRALLSSADHRMTVAITSPLNLLHELFTVRGAGTLLFLGAAVVDGGNYSGLDLERLGAIMESAFGTPPPADLFDRAIDRVFLAGDYLGAAIVAPTPRGPYLSKFAVDLRARGEGIGRDLWRAIKVRYPRLYWRTRLGNPIAPWYVQQCDGMVRTSRWQVFWYGFPIDQVPAAVNDANRAPADF